MYSTIPIHYLDYYLEKGFEGRVIDLRDESAYWYSHIAGAENFPFHELLENPSLLQNGEPFLFYCSRGSESILICNLFSRRGCQVVNVANGLNLYRGKYLVNG